MELINGSNRLNLLKYLTIKNQSMLEFSIKFKRRVFIILTICLCSFYGFGQQKTLSGTVTSSAGNFPLEGVSINIKGTKLGTISDGRGHFEIVANDGQVLVFTFTGYESEEMPVSKATTPLNVTMQQQFTSAEEVVVIGYGRERKSDLTGSVGAINSKSLEETSPTNVQEGLQGKIAGVQVSLGSGRPGGQPNVTVRGFTSITGSNKPLYVVDGVIMNNDDLADGTSAMDYLDPQNVASISVLKDASATAIYGARGSNGVIIITTKQPKGNMLSYSGSVSFGTLHKKLPVLDAKEFLKLEDIAWANASKYSLQDAVEDPALKRARRPDLFDSQGNPLYNTDWQKEGARTAISNSQHLSYGGGDNNNNYGISLGYRDDQGIMLASDFKVYTAQFSMNNRINNWLSAGGTINFSLANEKHPQSIGDGGTATPRQLVESLPIIPIFYPDGSFGGNKDYPGMDGGETPVRLAEQRASHINTNNIIGNAFLKFDLAKGLEFKSTFGANVTNQDNKSFAGPNLQWVSTFGNASISQINIKSWQEESQLTYKSDFSNGNSLGALLATSWQNVQSFTNSASVSNLNTLFYEYNNLSAASISAIPSSNNDEFSLNSYFARANYSIKNTYLFTVTGRVDGSSKFAKGAQYGFFPSGAFAWNLSNLEFLKNNPTITNLKLRLSYGVTGNSNIPNYRTVNRLVSNSYIFGGSIVSGTGAGTIANSNLKWEQDKEVDLGVDLGLFNNRLQFTGDIYYKKSSNILLNAPIPGSSGYTTVIRNIGSMENKGLELTFNSTNIRRSDFNWTTSFNISMNRNKILELVGGLDIISSGQAGFILREGAPVNSFYGYTILGTWGTDHANEASKFGELPGDLHFADINNDGAVNAADRSILGNGLPKGSGSFINTFSYKDFQLLIDLQFTYGNDVAWASVYPWRERTGIANSLKVIIDDAWTPDHQNTNIAQIRPNAGYVRPSELKSTWIYNGSFIRGRRFSISYRFPQETLKRLKIRSMRAFIAADNLFVITKFPGFDPEVSNSTTNFRQGFDMYGYPKPRTFQFGLNFDL